MPQSRTISAVRQRMVAEAWAGDAEAIVFCDADDVLTEQALTVHSASLAEHDISVGELRPFGSGQRPEAVAQDLLFGDSMPPRIEPGDLVETNVCGFSNTAVRRQALDSVANRHWPDIAGVDWWLFSILLRDGMSAAGTSAVVARYRQHDANTLGAGRTADVNTARRRVSIAADLFRARQWPGDGDRARAASELVSDPDFAAALAATPQRPGGPWHADVACWLTKYPANRTVSAGQ
jgi:hypothetical protein